MLQEVVKRDGRKEPLIPSKLNQWGEWASKSLGKYVDWVSVVTQTVSTLPNTCTTKELQQALIKVCLDHNTWSYNRMAGRLYAALIYKDMYGDEIPSVKAVHMKLIKAGLMVELGYSDAEYDKINSFMKHNRDFELAHYQLEQVRKKYALRDKSKGTEYESCQFVYMRMAMALAADEDSVTKLEDVKVYYEQFSKGVINAPTPNYVNLGTPLRGYASCCLHTTNDNAKSLAIGDHIAYTMTCMSAGIGAHINTRSMGDPVRNGTILHQGKLPYYRSLVAATKANLQSGRGGASTIYYPIFDPEVDVISRLKNPMSTEDKKIRGADYALQVNKFVVRKAAKNEDMFCFNSFTAPDLYEAFYSEDQELFAELYTKYEKRKSFKKVWFNPRDVIITVLNEGYETGRAYLHFVDEANTHTPFKESIYSSNLCNEIQLPTKGYSNMQDLYNPDFDGEGEIALCSLAAINVGKVKSEKDYEDAAYYSLKMIDKVIHLGEYVFPHLEKTAKSRLSAGIGITGLAEYMAQGKLSFSSPEGKRAMHELAERHAYYTIKASLRLAKEKGNAPWISKTKWSEGWLPIDTYNKNVDSVVDSTLLYDWENLRKGIISQGGIRNSVLIAHMPTESSSKASGATNGLYPIRDLNLMKTDNSNVIYWCASDGDRLSKHYELAWDVRSKDMIEMYSIFQKFCDQGISADMYRKILGADKVTSKEMLQDFFYMTKLGMKGRYYQNTATSNGTELIETEIEESGCADGVCKL